MRKIDAIGAEIANVTQSADGLEQLGRRLVAQHREYAAHLQNGSSYEEMGQSHIEEQMRLYMVYTLDRTLWEQLVTRCEQHALQDREAISPMFSQWGYLHDDLVENIGEAFGWNAEPPKSLGSTTFTQRLGMIVSTFGALSPTQIRQLEVGLGLEEGVAPPKSGGCYVATAVYGSYHTPEVRVLRRWRDFSLNTSAVGRQFVRFYYATSPHLLKIVGRSSWFVVPSRFALDRLVRLLRRSGYSEAPYADPEFQQTSHPILAGGRAPRRIILEMSLEPSVRLPVVAET